MKEISYYELLKMIKNGIIPKVVNYKITGYIENYIEYTAQYDRDTFTHYELTNHHREDENIHFYLNENYLESDMFDKSILIIEGTPKASPNSIRRSIGLPLQEDKKPPKKLDDILEIDDLAPQIDNNMFKILVQVIKNQHRINDICDYLEYLKNKGE